MRGPDDDRGDLVVLAGAEKRLADGLVDLEDPSERLVEEEADGVDGGGQDDVRAAVAREAHLQQRGGQAAVGAVVSGEDLVLLDERHDVAEGALKQREVHFGGVVAQRAEGLRQCRAAQSKRGRQRRRGRWRRRWRRRQGVEIDEEQLAVEDGVLDVRSHQVGDFLAVRKRGRYQREGRLD